MFIIAKKGGVGQSAGFHINVKETKIMCKNMTKKRQSDLIKMVGCDIRSKVKYPGIYLSMKNLDLFKNNYEKLWEAIQLDLKFCIS